MRLNKISVILFLLTAASSFLIITYKDDKLRLNTEYEIAADRKDDVTIDDGRIWVVDEGAKAGDVLTATMYCRHPGDYIIDVQADAEATGNGIRIESDGVLMTDNTISDEIMSFTGFDTGENVLSARFTVPDECRRIRLTVVYGGEGRLRVWRAHYESTGLYYNDAALAIAIMICAAVFLGLAFKRFGWSVGFFDEGNKKLSHFGVFIICVAIGCIASLEYMGKPIYRGADIQFHLERLTGLARALSSGQFPVRIQPFWHYDSGYPVSVFYPDILLYPAAILICLGVSEYFALCVTVYTVNIMTAYLGYRAYRRILDGDCVGMAASALYTLSSYRLLTLYQGSGIGGFISMMFFPTVLMGIYEILWGEEKKWPVLALGMTGVLSGHILSATHAVILCLIAALAGINRVFKKERLLSLVKAVTLTVLLNLWFIVPFLSMSGKDVRMFVAGSDIDKTPVFISQMFQWAVNTAGKGNVNGSETAGEMPLTLGIVLGLGLIVYIAYRVREKNKDVVGDLCVFLSAVSLWLSSEFFPWSYIHRVPVLGNFLYQGQFAWRYYIIATVALSAVAAKGLFRLMRSVSEGGALIIVAMAAIMSAAPFLDSITQRYEVFFADKYQFEFDFEAHTENRDYLFDGMSKNELLSLDRTVKAEGALIRSVKRNGVDAEIVYSKPDGEGRVILPIFHYGFYRIKANGQILTAKPAEHHRIEVTLPEAAVKDGVLKAEFKEPISWRISELISLFTALSAAVCFMRRNKQRSN